MSDQIQRLREVAEAATEGPWRTAVGNEVHASGQVGVVVADPLIGKADAEHIATFDPPTVLELLDRLERAEAAVERVRDAMVEAFDELPARYTEAAHGRADAWRTVREALDGGER